MMTPNPGKQLTIAVAGKTYARMPVRTHVITKDDDIFSVVKKYTDGFLQPGDYLFISERAVAITQGRAFPISEIVPSRLANFLVRYVMKSPHGIGLGSPWTMELAIREAGVLRILFAACVGAVTKVVGLKGWFYRAAGHAVNAIDGPCDYTLPPYNGYAKLGPKNPNGVAKRLKDAFGVEVVIIDANDLGVNILGNSSTLPAKFFADLFRDNPLGQSREQTPMAVVRDVK